jgi:hypothetical protein
MFKGGQQRNGSPGSRPEKYSLQHLQHLYKVLSKMQPVNVSKRSQAVEILRSISEVIIYGDQRQTNQIFDYFCEKNMLFLFTQMLQVPGGCGSAISRQIIQTVSILIQNIQNPTYLFYLLSNNHVNEIILHQFDFNDEDVLAQYASFIKMLSLLLDENTIQFMFDGRQASFPLYTESIKLLDSKEGMVRTHSRVLALNVYRMSDDAMAQFILSPAHRGVFGKLVRFVRGRCVELGNRLKWKDGASNVNGSNMNGSGANVSPSKFQREHQQQHQQQVATVDQIKSEVNDLIDEFYFFQDVLDAGKHGISDALSDAILIHFVYPLLIPALGLQEVGSTINADGKSNILQSNPSHLIRRVSSHAHDISTPDGGVGSQVSKLLSLFMLTQIMNAIQHENIVQSIAVCCMSRGMVDGGPVRPEETEENEIKHGALKDENYNRESVGEPDLFSFFVGYTDPMIKYNKKGEQKDQIEQKEQKEQISMKKNIKCNPPPRHNYVAPIPPPTDLLNKNVQYNSEDTDYDDEDQLDDEVEVGQVISQGENGNDCEKKITLESKNKEEEIDIRPRRGSSFSISLESEEYHHYQIEQRTCPTSSNVHRLHILASLVSQDERHVFMTIMLLRSFIRTMNPSFLANVGLLPASMVDEVLGDEDQQRRRRRARTRSGSEGGSSRRTWSASYTELDLANDVKKEEDRLRRGLSKEEVLEEELESAAIAAAEAALESKIEATTSETVTTSMGPGVVLEVRKDDGVQIVELEWKLANQSKAIMYMNIASKAIKNASGTLSPTKKIPMKTPLPKPEPGAQGCPSVEPSLPLQVHSLSRSISSAPSTTTTAVPRPSLSPSSTLPATATTPTKNRQFQYPTFIVESMLSILAREARSPNNCRLLTFRAVITFIMELVSDSTVMPGLPLVHPLHLSVVTCAISRCSIALCHYLKKSKFLERPNHRFIEIFETEHRIVLNNYKHDPTLETIAGRCEQLLSVAHGPKMGAGGRSKSLEDRLPFGDVENVRQLVRVSLLLRQLEMKLGGVNYPQRLIDDDNTDNNSDGSESGTNINGDLERENELVDLSKRKHVQCRLRIVKNDQRIDQTPERPVFLIITPLVMSVASVVPLTAPKDRSRKIAQNQQVQNTSVVPIHLIGAIVDTSDNKTLHLTVFSHTQPKLFQQLGGNGGKPSALSCWRMTVGFANPGACSWTKATIEKHRAELRRRKLGRICTMLGIAEYFSESTL